MADEYQQSTEGGPDFDPGPIAEAAFQQAQADGLSPEQTFEVVANAIGSAAQEAGIPQEEVETVMQAAGQAFEQTINDGGSPQDAFDAAMSAGEAAAMEMGPEGDDMGPPDGLLPIDQAVADAMHEAMDAGASPEEAFAAGMEAGGQAAAEQGVPAEEWEAVAASATEAFNTALETGGTVEDAMHAAVEANDGFTPDAYVPEGYMPPPHEEGMAEGDMPPPPEGDMPPPEGDMMAEGDMPPPPPPEGDMPPPEGDMMAEGDDPIGALASQAFEQAQADGLSPQETFDAVANAMSQGMEEAGIPQEIADAGLSAAGEAFAGAMNDGADPTEAFESAMQAGEAAVNQAFEDSGMGDMLDAALGEPGGDMPPPGDEPLPAEMTVEQDMAQHEMTDMPEGDMPPPDMPDGDMPVDEPAPEETDVA